MQDQMQKLASGGQSAYNPTIIDPKKYQKAREGRNRFFLSLLACGAGISMLYFVPLAIVRRVQSRLFKSRCAGKVLDLTPKITDDKTVALYESSRALRVEFLVKEIIRDDGAYKVDETADEATQDERRKSMTLEFLTRNDPAWVTSYVTFAVVDEASTKCSNFKKYDTVVIRNELSNLDDAAAAAMLERAQALVAPEGHVIVIELGRPSLALLATFLSWFHTTTDSTIYLTREYDRWVPQHCKELEVVESSRRLLGTHYALALTPRKSSCHDK